MVGAASSQAARVESLWWVFFWILSVIYLLVLLFLITGSFRLRRERMAAEVASGGAPEVEPSAAGEERLKRSVVAAVSATVVVLTVMFFSELFTGRALHAMSSDPDPVEIKVTGHQWWWEVQYEDKLLSNSVTTANELHLPVGKAARIKLQSPDVIHSFWVPNLTPKKDLIPRHETWIMVKADKAGEFRGQCAEYCGLQHAHMRFKVVTEPQKNFEEWLAAGRQSAPEPATESQRRGKLILEQSSCAMCHTISGTAARGTVGPNLTHVWGRGYIGAGTLPINRGNLGGWILDPQHVKPGVHMPQNQISADNLQYLLDFLETLH